MSKNKKKQKYNLPSVDGINVMELLCNITIKENKKTPPPFALELGVPANNIEKQLKEQNIEFDPSCIKKHDKLIKAIVDLKNEGFISKNKAQKLIEKIYVRSISHVCFIYEMM